MADVSPAPWDAMSAALTSTPIAAYDPSDPACIASGLKYFDGPGSLSRYLARRTSDAHDAVKVWDLDRVTGGWYLRPHAA